MSDPKFTLPRIAGECVCGGSRENPNPDCERCQLVAFVYRVKDLRESQREYFKSRRHDVLMRSKDLEKDLDEEIERMTTIQAGLFDDPPPWTTEEELELRMEVDDGS